MGLLSLTVLLLSIDSGVFAAPTKVGQPNDLFYAAKQSVIDTVGEEVLCEFCEFVVKLVQSFFESTITEKILADLATEACKKFEKQDDYICTNIIQEFKVCGLALVSHGQADCATITKTHPLQSAHQSSRNL